VKVFQDPGAIPGASTKYYLTELGGRIRLDWIMETIRQHGEEWWLRYQSFKL